MSDEIPEAIPAPVAARSPKFALWAGLGALLAAAGVAMLLGAGPGRVDSIRVTKYGMLPEGIVEAPDYFVSLTVRGNDSVTTVTTNRYDDVPIGNGLDFKLPAPVELTEVAAAELLDKDIMSDDMLDRVEVRSRVCRGQNYEFTFRGPESPWRRGGIASLAGGAAILVAAAIMLVRAKAI